VIKLQKQQRLRAIDTITDSASAKIPFNRPAYISMIKRLKKGEATGIIVWKIDRLARNHLEWGELMHLLQTGVIQSIWTMHREYQSRDSALLISLEASMATQYSVDLAEIVKRGLHKKVAMGQPPIIAPMGYLNTKLNEHGSNSIIVDPERWPLMRKAFDLMLTRQYTVAQVANILNTEYNYRSRATRRRLSKPLGVSVLYRAITDPFYTGYFNYKGELHKGVYKPMITIEEFDTIQIILGRKYLSKPHKHEFAYTGFIKCGCCGCAITASKKLKKLRTTGEYKTYTFYHCTKRRGAAICPDKQYTTEHEMEAMIENELQHIALTPLWKTWAFETVKEDYDEELDKQRELLKSIHKYEQKLLSELDTLLDLRISNDLTEEKYNQKKAERKHELMRVQEKHKKVENNINDWIEQVNDKLNFAETIIDSFKKDDPKLKKRICTDIGWNWILQGKKLTFTRHEWFDDIEKIKSHFVQEKARLEPIKTFVEYRQNPSFDVLRSLLSALRDHIRTESNISFISFLD
jgi:DNA invertase Pin-like site-specific DNA recombinase